jgi:Glycogen debranching enzyme, glucanotransferase domain
MQVCPTRFEKARNYGRVTIIIFSTKFSAPLIETLFTRLPHNERTLKHPSGSLAVANNGWIWAHNPLEDFAGPQSRAYLRREVIVWGDCVKLRYGRGPVYCVSYPC